MDEPNKQVEIEWTADGPLSPITVEDYRLLSWIHHYGKVYPKFVPMAYNNNDRIKAIGSFVAITVGIYCFWAGVFKVGQCLYSAMR
jgi:hypothetical protein